MNNATPTTKTLKVSGYPGDAKVLLAFNFSDEVTPPDLAGFTIQVTPPGGASYYLYNDLQFENPADHAQVSGEPPYSTANAPIHKFRWVHVPGLDHQGLNPPYGDYTYTVTPRYFNAGRMLALDPTDSAAITVSLRPFDTGSIKIGFTRGFVQSQAFVRHFGHSVPTRPKGAPVNFSTSAHAGVDPQGNPFTYADQFRWLGFTARDRVFELLDYVQKTDGVMMDVFAYDFNEPDVIDAMLALVKQNKVRIILDNAALHHSTKVAKPEDEFEALFRKAGGDDTTIKRGHFGRYAHDKVFVIYENKIATTTLLGSTNFSVTGLYVNANHVIVIRDAEVAKTYAGVFQASWDADVREAAFVATAWSRQTFPFPASGTRPAFDVTFSPHDKGKASGRLQEIVDRCTYEEDHQGNVFFAVMELKDSPNPVYDALNALHANPKVFSMGISDDPENIVLYPLGSTTGVEVSGKPGSTALPPPFNQVPTIGTDHQIHHKFVVCGFGRPDAVVYGSSSNLALAGEQVNGDNLVCFHDRDIATVFTIEALLLVDHFNFLDARAMAPKGKGKAAIVAPPPADKRTAATQAGWFLGTTNAWANKYFDKNDLHYRDRLMFG